MEAKLYQQFLLFREAHFQQMTIIDGLFAKKTEFALSRRDSKIIKMYTKSIVEYVM